MFTDQLLQRILHRTSHISRKKAAGFTLIELIVVIMIMGIMAIALFAFLVPQKQLEKSKDAVRKHDAEQIKQALDLYYNDHECYPKTLAFGTIWKENTTVYMQKVPQDPDCSSNPTLCYRYQVKTTDVCPQWNIVYVPAEGTFSESQTNGVTNCALSLLNSCMPADGSTWACAISGTPDCAYISASTMPASSGTGGSGGVSCTGGGGYVCTPNGCNFGTQGGTVYCSFQECNQAYTSHKC